ncbi:MAG: transmembrane Mn(2+) transporter, partial [Verrucomicrobiota bacterium]
LAEVLAANEATASASFTPDPNPHPPTAELSAGIDVYFWAILISIITAFILYRGKYGMIESTVSTLVALFTLVSSLNLVFLQANPVWAVKPAEWWQGLQFRVPPPQEGLTPIATALATFGIIGVAAGELIFYPYWCLEKGYAAHIGPRDNSPEWNERARGWMKVLRWDAFASLIVYTFSTVCFYLLGASVLGRAGLEAEGMNMIRTLAAMYEPVFHEKAVGLFLLAASVILFSTFFVTNASKARVLTDALAIFGWRKRGKEGDRRWVRGLSIALPLISCVIFLFIPKPKFLILMAGMMQSFLLPMIAFAAIWFRYHHTSPDLRPSKTWDILLWISGAGLLIAGVWMALSKIL